MLKLNYKNVDAQVIGEENGLNLAEEFANYKDRITSIIADLPTSFLLPFLAQIKISLFCTHNFSGMFIFTLTISRKHSLPSWIFDDLKTIVPVWEMSVGR